MMFARIALAAAFSVTLTVMAQAQAQQPSMETASQLFQSGRFDDAGKVYAQIASQDQTNEAALRGLGRVALLSNRLGDAQAWLEKALALRPDDADLKVMLAATFYRSDDFQKAAAALDGVDVRSNKLLTSQYPTLNVAQLQSFKGQIPYEVQGEGQSTRLKFVNSDLLPLLSVRVNGGEPVIFFIDTGGSEVALDSDFARELGVPQFGSVQGTFSGGQHAMVQSGRIETLTLGDWTVRNVPVAMLPLRQLSKDFGVKRIDGIIGTNLLYHFLATLDYPNGELILRRKNAENRKQFEASSSNRAVIPFWIAGDHFMVAWGRVNANQPTLLFIDSGLAGAGVKLAQSVIKEAGIVLDESKASEGAGGGGKLKLVPYTVRQLSLGDIQQKDVPGLFDGPFPWEHSFGFHLAGMVGHDFLKPYAVTFDFDNMKMYLR